ncbi:MAG TPA: hypothetical protein VGE47_17120, partial [Burkholderiaceae bacterium]
TEGDEQPADDDPEEEFEFGFKKYRAKKSLKEGVGKLLKEYTQATQSAAKTKELEERAQRLEEQSRASEEEYAARVKLKEINAEWDKFKDWGWAQVQQLSQTDPVKADEIWKYKQHLALEKQSLEQTVSTARQRHFQEMQRDTAKRLDETRAYAPKLPGYKGEETVKEAIEFAKSEGWTNEDLQRVMSPRVLKTFHLARIGAAALSKPAPKPQAPAVEPLETVGARSNPPARKPLSQMSVADHAAILKKKAGAR